MSDKYRDGCPSKKFGLSWLVVQLVYLGAWLSDPLGRYRR